ncbi:MAG: hypothetical protein JJ975_01450 [Bacteroidia bacterium]|nr:hypothetical protein [Bacteroidia bacterium]
MDTFLSLLVGFVIGILFFAWDNKKGYVWYKRWYDLSHKTPLDSDNVYSFINNQPFSKRLVPAIILTVLFAWGSWLLGDLNLIITLVTGMLSLVGVIAGFYVGPMVMNKLPKGLKEANKTLKKIDELEKDLLDDQKEPKPQQPQAPEQSSSDKTDDKKDTDWRKGVQDFLDK